MNIIGIDPGLDGALAIITDNGNVEAIHDTPTITLDVARGTKRVYDLKRMAGWLRPLQPGVFGEGACAFVENVHSMPGQGVRSMFSMGYGVGAWHGLLTALRIPYTLVTPQSWTKAFGLTGPDKDAHRVKAANLFPRVSDLFARKKDDGRADAILIAEYGRRARL